MGAAFTVKPNNWKDFLGIDENKTELFACLSPEAIRLPLALLVDGKELYAPDGSGVLCSPSESYCARLAPCSQEEADTRLRLPLAGGVQKGYL